MANVKISDLTAASAGAAANQFEINEAGTSKSLTLEQIATYVETNFNATTAGVELVGAGELADDTTPTLTGDLDGDGFNLLDLGVLTLREQAAADADTAGLGQIWVKTATPNQLWFTDDAGTDYQLGVSAGVSANYRYRVLDSGTSYTPDADVTAFYVMVFGSTGGRDADGNGGVTGGGYSEKYYSSPAGPYTYAIGAGGTTSGTAGGTTSFDVCSVTGGGGTTTTTGATTGGVGSGGDFNASGGTGGNGSGAEDGGQGGFGSRCGNGGNGSNYSGTDGGGGGGTGGNNASGATGGIAGTESGSAMTLPEPFASATRSYDAGSDGTGQAGGAGANARMSTSIHTQYLLQNDDLGEIMWLVESDGYGVPTNFKFFSVQTAQQNQAQAGYDGAVALIEVL